MICNIHSVLYSHYWLSVWPTILALDGSTRAGPRLYRCNSTNILSSNSADPHQPRPGARRPSQPHHRPAKMNDGQRSGGRDRSTGRLVGWLVGCVPVFSLAGAGPAVAPGGGLQVWPGLSMSGRRLCTQAVRTTPPYYRVLVWSPGGET